MAASAHLKTLEYQTSTKYVGDLYPAIVYKSVIEPSTGLVSWLQWSSGLAFDINGGVPVLGHLHKARRARAQGTVNGYPVYMTDSCCWMTDDVPYSATCAEYMEVPHEARMDFVVAFSPDCDTIYATGGYTPSFFTLYPDGSGGLEGFAEFTRERFDGTYYEKFRVTATCDFTDLGAGLVQVIIWEYQMVETTVNGVPGTPDSQSFRSIVPPNDAQEIWSYSAALCRGTYYWTSTPIPGAGTYARLRVD